MFQTPDIGQTLILLDQFNKMSNNVSVDEYNALVRKHNSLIADFNNLLTLYRHLYVIYETVLENKK